MGLSIKVEKRRLGELTNRLQELDGTEVEAGFFEEARYGPENHNLPVAQVAAYNNFGTSFNPTRPFMDNTFEDNMNQLHMGIGVKKVFIAALTNGRSTQRMLRVLGETIADLMREEIDDYPGSNSPSTIARKGFNDPLYDTGKMLESVRFKIN